MGNSISSNLKEEFKDEIEIINKIIKEIINNNSFVNDEYNFLSQDVCDNYFIMFESKIKKHLKVHLNGLADMLYIFPLKNNVDKDSVCKMVTHHYIKIFYLLKVIKYIYDTENRGDGNIASIIFKNTHLESDILYIIYCDAKQDDGSKSVDLTNLKGMKLFFNSILTEKEGAHFMSILRNIFELKYKEKDMVKLNVQTCKMYNNLMNKKHKCNETILNFKDKYNTKVKVVRKNPILDERYCNGNKKTITVKYSGSIKTLYMKMIENYKNNIKNVKKLLFEIIDQKNKRLKDLNSEKLDIAIGKVKNTIMTFYITSLIDYNNLLNEAFNKLKK